MLTTYCIVTLVSGHSTVAVFKSNFAPKLECPAAVPGRDQLVAVLANKAISPDE